MEGPVKDGILYVQHFKFGKRSWKKVRAQLFAAGPSGVARMEQFAVRDGSGPEKTSLRRGERRVLRLADCVSVGPAGSEGCPRGTAAFCLRTLDKSHVLAAEQPDEWVAQLCQLAFQGTKEMAPGSNRASPSSGLHMEENTIYSSWHAPNEFPVLLLRTEASTRCGLSGRYLLAVLPERLVLKELQTRQPLLAWPYPFLRKFGQDQAMLSFEAGRRCDSGEGVFTFSTGRAAEICGLISAAIARQRNQEPWQHPASSPEGAPSASWALEDGGATPPAWLRPEHPPPQPCSREPGAPDRVDHTFPVIYASIARGPQPLPAAVRREPEPEAWGQQPSEHLYENLCGPEPDCPGRGLDQAAASWHRSCREPPEGSSGPEAPIYDNSCMVAAARSGAPSPVLQPRYQRLQDPEGPDSAAHGEATASNGLRRRLVTLLSREAAPPVPGRTPSPADRA
ncbi:docking protein 3 [Alligator mississippiensis]|uniref:Docking protein 3 n=1 Tax=Alligator mississippiensis TaxID=8496 RepID=A0A151M6E6_ALLMI|nr:docking protein 3 [Alligator mississippiensis]